MAKYSTSRRDFLTVGSLGFLGLTLRDTLAAAAASPASAARANSVILFWLEGGPSHIDTFDPKPNSNFRPMSTNVAGIQVSELLPKLAKRMDKMALVRSMHTRGNDHPQATHYVITGHEINPAMQFPSLGSIVSRELEPRNAVPPHVLVPKWDRGRQYEDYFRAAFLGGEYDPMCIPDPSKPDFAVTDLSLPKTVSEASVESRSAFLKAVDRRYRALNEKAEHADLDAYTAQAWKMILTPAVRDAFDLSKESDKTKEQYGKDSVGSSLLLARRLVEAGSRFVTAAGYHGTSWDTHSDNDRGTATASPLRSTARSRPLSTIFRRAGCSRRRSSSRWGSSAARRSSMPILAAITGRTAGRWRSRAAGSAGIVIGASDEQARTSPTASSPWETCSRRSTSSSGSTGARST